MNNRAKDFLVSSSRYPGVYPEVWSVFQYSLSLRPGPREQVLREPREI